MVLSNFSNDFLTVASGKVDEKYIVSRFKKIKIKTKKRGDESVQSEMQELDLLNKIFSQTDINMDDIPVKMPNVKFQPGMHS